VLRHFAGWADKIEGRWISPQPFFGQARQAYTIREPLGVVGAITAWNAPTMIAAWKLGPALAAGNAVVLKPAEDACLSSLHLATLIDEVGFPPGTVNVVPGHGPITGAALAGHPGVDKITFTGSPEVGRAIALQAASDFRRITLELGGKSPQIVLADADLSAVLPGVAMGFLANQGEICAAGTRILVSSKHYDDVVAGLAEAAAGVRLGDPFDEETNMGALINEKQLARVTGYITQGKAEGADLVTGGKRLDRDGYFVEPTVFSGGDNEMSIARDEIFGPVALVMRFRRCRRRDPAGERHPLRARRVRLDRKPLGRSPRRRRCARGKRLDQRIGAAGRTAPVGRRQNEWDRTRARLGGHRGQYRGEDRHVHTLRSVTTHHRVDGGET
jgi:acyl-CoA reductase-like NAD-dependent aldehyde dehydrogenase